MDERLGTFENEADAYAQCEAAGYTAMKFDFPADDNEFIHLIRDRRDQRLGWARIMDITQPGHQTVVTGAQRHTELHLTRHRRDAPGVAMQALSNTSKTGLREPMRSGSC